METVTSNYLFQFVVSGIVVLLHLYFISVINPIKKSIERIETEKDKQWDAIGAIEKQLNTLQGEHNERRTKNHE